MSFGLMKVRINLFRSCLKSKNIQESICGNRAFDTSLHRNKNDILNQTQFLMLFLTI